ncbi:hypothetical protein [Galbibacter mesophilus]|uniref:hypothetical protein n=1 Tax=Galbibacter mesophilus TaxID=379069 RepID=UPI00191E7EB4|nr:hypothetical protein [Galbibacter mesophilus]MCM5663184.1 hypothetical protein [Galbibacter mesophilus]
MTTPLVNQSLFFQFCLAFSILISSFCNAQSITAYNLNNYTAQEGLNATVSNNTLTINWIGENDSKLRMAFKIVENTPTITQLSIKEKDSDWILLASNVISDYKVTTGLRRVTQQQTEPLEGLGIPLTEEKLNEIKWDAFWDAPLYTSSEPPRSHGGSIPAKEPFANHPGMPRDPSEVESHTLQFKNTSCQVTTNGARLEIVFEGVEIGFFSGYLQFDIFKHSNLIRQMVVAKTEKPSVAFKYEAELNGFSLTSKTQIGWRDLEEVWKTHQIEKTVNNERQIVVGNNRLIAAEFNQGSIAAFPPPHSFYWARESEQNLGYGWYQKNGNNSYGFGIRQANGEKDPEFYHNFALYSARPNKWQRMPIFFYISSKPHTEAIKKALAFTHNDVFKPLKGYKVMGSHYHVGLVKRLKKLGGFDKKVNDIETMKKVGVDIYSIIDGVRGPGRHDKGELFLKDLAEYYEAARSQSDENFLVMPNDENSTDGRRPFMGGHYDLMLSKPVYWRPQRLEGEPLIENHPNYGTVYNIGTPEDLMKMTEKENALISMAHPNTKKSTGYPMAIWDEPHFQHKNYFGLGYRWGMGIDASEIRLGEYRFQKLWDETNNEMTKNGHALKFALAISEARSDKGDRGKPSEDDTYGMSPVSYVKLNSVPSVDDMSPIINSLKKGDFFVTSGEILIPHYEVLGTGNSKTIVAEVEWTFPLDFVELVWGDGESIDRKIISTTDLPAFSKKRFEIPFDATGKKWIRFAAWDVATNGAMVQPVNLTVQK